MTIGVFDQYVLLAALRLTDGYGITIRQEIGRRTGRAPSVAAVYSALKRLERDGLLKGRDGGPSARRGGRSKRFFAATPKGRATLRAALKALDAMRAGLEP